MSSTLPPSPDLSPDLDLLPDIDNGAVANAPLAPIKIKTPFWKSIKTQLFVAVMGSSMLGLGGMGWFLYNTLEQQGKAQIASNLDGQAQRLESNLKQVEQFTHSLKVATESLYNGNSRQPEDYKTLVTAFLASKPNLVQGFGVMQTPNGLVSNRTWYGPYIYEPDDQSKIRLKPTEERLPNTNAFIFGDLLFADQYPQQDYYSKTLKQNRFFWDEPYITSTYAIALTSYTGALKDNQGKVIGLVSADVSLKDLVQRYAKLHAYQQSGHFALLSSSGNLIAYPPDPNKAAKMVNAKQVSGLQDVWVKIQERVAAKPTGIVEVSGNGNYVAYQRLDNGWLLLAEVPRTTVTAPAIASTAGAVLVVGLALAGSVFWFIKRLNDKLKPMLEECNLLVSVDPQAQAVMSQQSELDRLSNSFYMLLSQLSRKEDEIRNEATFNTLNQERLRTATEAESEAHILASEVEHLLGVVEAIEAGDLTVEAQVSQRVTGLLADCLNQLVAEWGRVMTVVNRTAEQVTTGATYLEGLALSTNSQAEQQSLAVNQVQALMANVNLRCQETAKQAVATDAAMEQSQTAVAEGLQQIELMQKGITQLQTGTNQIIQRVQSMTEFITLASQFTRDQKRVATLTRVLALNASMTATRAAGQEDPEQFASVAKEFAAIAAQVNDLAVQTNQSLQLLQQRTDQIQTTISGVNSDVVEIDGLMQQFSHSVDQSQQVLGSIQGATERVVQLGQQVTQSSQEIVQAAQTTLTSLETTAVAVTSTAEQSAQMRAEASNMEQLAQKLLGRVNFFRLPEEEFEMEDLSIVSMVRPKKLEYGTNNILALAEADVADFEQANFDAREAKAEFEPEHYDPAEQLISQ
jgi:methyl-accepting chemotaxis protein PixJ